MAYKFQLGAAKASGSLSPTDDNAFDLGSSGKEWKDLYIDGTAYVDAINYNGTAVSATAAELNKLASCNVTTAELNKLAGSSNTSAANKLIILDANGDFEMQDSDKIYFGDGADVSIHWDGSAMKIGTDTSGAPITIGHSTSEVTVADNLTITGNLTVNGTTTSVNSTTINITSSFTFEGVADAHETTLHGGGDGTGATPTTDLTVYLPSFSASAGTQAFYLPVMIDAPTDASSKVTAAEFALLDGASSNSNVTILDSDQMLINDGGTMKQTAMDDMKTYIFGAISGDATSDASGAITLAANSVSQAQLDDDAVGADELASNAVVNASVVDGAIKADKLDIDGSTDIGAALADADLFIVDDGAGGTNRKCTMSRLKTYIGGGSMSVYKLSGAVGGATVDGVIAAASGSGFYYNEAVTSEEEGLNHDSIYFLSGTSWSTGDHIRLKAPDFNTSGKISVYFQSSSLGDFIHYLDGNGGDCTGSTGAGQLSEIGTHADDIPVIVLESNQAAVSLVMYVSATDSGLTEYHWAIM